MSFLTSVDIMERVEKEDETREKNCIAYVQQEKPHTNVRSIAIKETNTKFHKS